MLHLPFYDPIEKKIKLEIADKWTVHFFLFLQAIKKKFHVEIKNTYIAGSQGLYLLKTGKLDPEHDVDGLIMLKNESDKELITNFICSSEGAHFVEEYLGCDGIFTTHWTHTDTWVSVDKKYEIRLDTGSLTTDAMHRDIAAYSIHISQDREVKDITTRGIPDIQHSVLNPVYSNVEKACVAYQNDPVKILRLLRKFVEGDGKWRYGYFAKTALQLIVSEWNPNQVTPEIKNKFKNWLIRHLEFRYHKDEPIIDAKKISRLNRFVSEIYRFEIHTLTGLYDWPDKKELGDYLKKKNRKVTNGARQVFYRHYKKIEASKEEKIYENIISEQIPVEKIKKPVSMPERTTIKKQISKKPKTLPQKISIEPEKKIERIEDASLPICFDSLKDIVLLSGLIEKLRSPEKAKEKSLDRFKEVALMLGIPYLSELEKVSDKRGKEAQKKIIEKTCLKKLKALHDNPATLAMFLRKSKKIRQTSIDQFMACKPWPGAHEIARLTDEQGAIDTSVVTRIFGFDPQTGIAKEEYKVSILPDFIHQANVFEKQIKGFKDALQKLEEGNNDISPENDYYQLEEEVSKDEKYINLKENLNDIFDWTCQLEELDKEDALKYDFISLGLGHYADCLSAMAFAFSFTEKLKKNDCNTSYASVRILARDIFKIFYSEFDPHCEPDTLVAYAEKVGKILVNKGHEKYIHINKKIKQYKKDKKKDSSSEKNIRYSMDNSISKLDKLRKEEQLNLWILDKLPKVLAGKMSPVKDMLRLAKFISTLPSPQIAGNQMFLRKFLENFDIPMEEMDEERAFIILTNLNNTEKPEFLIKTMKKIQLQEIESVDVFMEYMPWPDEINKLGNLMEEKEEAFNISVAKELGFSPVYGTHPVSDKARQKNRELKNHKKEWKNLKGRIENNVEHCLCRIKPLIVEAEKIAYPAIMNIENMIKNELHYINLEDEQKYRLETEQMQCQVWVLENLFEILDRNPSDSLELTASLETSLYNDFCLFAPPDDRVDHQSVKLDRNNYIQCDQGRRGGLP